MPRVRRCRALLALIWAVCVLTISPRVWAQPAAAASALEPDLRDAIDAAARAEMDRQGLVGLALGVIRDGEVVYTAGFGLADRASDTPVTPKTMFRWASISKPVTAVAAMQLVERGELDLDADLRTYVPEFPDKGVSITSRQLLSHLGGIVHYSNGPVIATKREYDDDHPYEDVVLALDTFMESPLVNAPGEKFSYSTRGFMLMSAVVQRAGDEPFFTQVRERICTPLGLTTLQPDYQWLDIPDRATGYQRVRGLVLPSTNTDVSWKLGGGGFISNVEDLAGFAAGLIGDELMQPEIKAIMWTEQTTSKGDGVGYGLGFDVSRPNGALRIAHNGAQEKTRTRMVIYPEQRHGLVVMTNSEWAEVGPITTAIYRGIRAWESGEVEGN